MWAWSLRANMETYEKAKCSLEKKELESSFKLFTDFIDSQRPIEHKKELTDAFNSRGHIRYLWVDFDEAIEDYSAALELDPEFAVAYYNRGQIHYRLGNPTDVIKLIVDCLSDGRSIRDGKM